MKTNMKKLISALLALVMVSGLFAAMPLTASAAESTVNWDDFYIVTQPQGRTIKRGDTFTLSFEVNVPDGVEVEYQWFGIANGTFKVATSEPFLICSPGDEYYPVLDTMFVPKAIGSATYLCTIVGYEKDGDEIVSQKMLGIGRVTVNMKGSIGDLMYSFLNVPILAALGPVTAVLPSIMTGVITYPFIALYFTLIMPVMLFFSLIFEYLA